MSNEITTPSPVKPGWKTTEFYQTLILQALAFATILGFLSPSESAGIGGNITTMIEHVVALLVAGGTVVSYIKNRTQAKAGGQ
jgi:hypothetical protein